MIHSCINNLYILYGCGNLYSTSNYPLYFRLTSIYCQIISFYLIYSLSLSILLELDKNITFVKLENGFQYNAYVYACVNANAYACTSICIRIIHIYRKQSNVSARMASAKPIKVQMHGDADGMPSSMLTGEL